jgi:hypothetical protein
MPIPKLGKIEYVDVRDIWNDEARDFTPWLGSEEGLGLLSETIEATLELVIQEAKVGPFSADLLLKVVGEEDHLVVVENQFGKTDHDHLGKIITYASGLKAKTIVWIAETFTDEHRQALLWMNEIAGERVGLFGLEVYAVKIGDSDPAPQFKVIHQPNIWAEAVREAREEAELSTTKLDQQRFWEEMKDYIINKGSKLPVQKPLPHHWYNIAIGRSNFSIAMTVNTKLNRVGCELYLAGSKAKQAFGILKQDQAVIEKEIGQPLEWQLLESKEASRIIIYHDGSIYNDLEKQQAKEWLYEMALCFHKVFGQRVRQIVLPDDTQ